MKLRISFRSFKGGLSRCARFWPLYRHGVDITLKKKCPNPLFSSEWCICRHCQIFALHPSNCQRVFLTRFFGVVLTRNRKKGNKNNSERPCTDISRYRKICVGNILIKKGVQVKLFSVHFHYIQYRYPDEKHRGQKKVTEVLFLVNMWTNDRKLSWAVSC